MKQCHNTLLVERVTVHRPFHSRNNPDSYRCEQASCCSSGSARCTHINCFVEALSSLTAKWSSHTVCRVCPLCHHDGHQLHKAHQHVLTAFQPQMLLPPHNSLVLVAMQEGQLLAMGPMHVVCRAPGLQAPQLSVLITTSISASAYHQLLL